MSTSTDLIEAQLTAALAAANAQITAAVVQAQAQLQAAIDSSTIRANADVRCATITGDDHVQATSTMANAEVTAAQIRSSTDLQVANVTVSNQLAVAQTNLTGTEYTAAWRYQGDIYTANLNNSTQVQVAEIQVANQLAVAQLNASYERDVATINHAFDPQVATINHASDLPVAQLNNSTQTAVANINAASALAVKDVDLTLLDTKLAWAQEKWNLVWPFVQSTFANNSGQIDPTAAYNAMIATVGMPPSFVPTSVYTEQQIQQQLNVAYSRILQSVHTKTRSAEIDLAGRGFSSSSPIINAIRMGYEGYAIMASADEEVKIRLGSATANADQVLKSQTEAIAYYEQNLQAYTALEKTLADMFTGMLSATAQLVSAGS